MTKEWAKPLPRTSTVREPEESCPARRNGHITWTLGSARENRCKPERNNECSSPSRWLIHPSKPFAYPEPLQPCGC